MELSRLVASITAQVCGPADVEIRGIEYDSRKVKKGDLFIALPGRHHDGKLFVPPALAAGAAAVVADAPVPHGGAALAIVPDPLAAMAALSAVFYHHPDRRLLLLGITGTNGKTTISYFLESIFRHARRHPGVMGTINYRYAGSAVPAPNTTPQSVDVFRILHEMLKARCDVAVMEVSSHALSLGRVAGIEYDGAVFTNLTQDHLDFHPSMEDYFAAKAKLFAGLVGGEKKLPKFAIINGDDPWGRKLTAKTARGAHVVTYGLGAKNEFRAEHIRISSKASEFTLISPDGKRKLILSHLGRHNVYNALAAVAAAVQCGVSLDSAVEALRHAPAVPGRLEKVEAGQPFTVVVDYAHTEDALRNVLGALRGLRPSRIITVFGCGGDRDRSKRPLMGEVATELSDFVFVTSDNPRSEPPERITLDIEVGIRRRHRDNYQVVVDREQAIAAAVSMAQKGDIVLLAGKGHENYQIIGDQRFPFNDVDVARKYLLMTVR